MNVSWFLLERYALAETDAAEAAQVEAALAQSAELRERLGRIRADVSVPPLPQRRPVIRLRFRSVWRFGAMAAAALVLVTTGLTLRRVLVPEPSGAKGGALTVTLVRLHGDSVAADPT